MIFHITDPPILKLENKRKKNEKLALCLYLWFNITQNKYAVIFTLWRRIVIYVFTAKYHWSLESDMIDIFSSSGQRPAELLLSPCVCLSVRLSHSVSPWIVKLSAPNFTSG